VDFVESVIRIPSPSGRGVCQLHGGDRLLKDFGSVALIDLVSDTINRNYFCSELKVAVTCMAATFFFRRPRMVTSRQVINDFLSRNKCMLGVSAISLASLLVIAPFTTGREPGLTRASAIQFFLLSTVLGKMADFINEEKA
jgi:hypothetical protein